MVDMRPGTTICISCSYPASFTFGGNGEKLRGRAAGSTSGASLRRLGGWILRICRLLVPAVAEAVRRE